MTLIEFMTRYPAKFDAWLHEVAVRTMLETAAELAPRQQPEMKEASS